MPEMVKTKQNRTKKKKKKKPSKKPPTKLLGKQQQEIESKSKLKQHGPTQESIHVIDENRRQRK